MWHSRERAHGQSVEREGREGSSSRRCDVWGRCAGAAAEQAAGCWSGRRAAWRERRERPGAGAAQVRRPSARGMRRPAAAQARLSTCRLPAARRQLQAPAGRVQSEARPRHRRAHAAPHAAGAAACGAAQARPQSAAHLSRLACAARCKNSGARRPAIHAQTTATPALERSSAEFPSKRRPSNKPALSCWARSLISLCASRKSRQLTEADRERAGRARWRLLPVSQPSFSPPALCARRRVCRHRARTDARHGYGRESSVRGAHQRGVTPRRRAALAARSAAACRRKNVERAASQQMQPPASSSAASASDADAAAPQDAGEAAHLQSADAALKLLALRRRQAECEAKRLGRPAVSILK